MLTLGAASLSGCGGGGGSTPTPPTPPTNSITITSISVKLPSVCQDTTLYADSTIVPLHSNFGYLNARADGSAIDENLGAFNPNEPVTTNDILNRLGGSLNQKAAQIWYFLGGPLNPNGGTPDGKTYLYCIDSKSNHHDEVSFAIDNGSGQRLSSNLVLGTNINYDGPIQLVGTVNKAAKSKHGIYLYDAKHPHQHQQTDTLNNTNKL